MSQADPNAHIRDYLSYYMELPPGPQYAVMLSGPWGIGKTYLLDHLLKDHFGPQSSIDAVTAAAAKAAEEPRSWLFGGQTKEREAKEAPPKKQRYVYVSLYGLSSPKEIDDAILTSMYPALGWPSTKVAGRIVGVVLSALKLPTNVNATDFMARYDVDLYVFDDLERCKMPVDAALGYINEFVEHSLNKVIVVANELEIKDPKYNAIREKVIGKTLAMKPALESALASFIEKLPAGSARDLIDADRSLIRDVFVRSGVNNLRILQRSLWDLVRVLRELTDAHRSKADGVRAIMHLVLAWSFELRSGRLDAGKLSNRQSSLVARLSRPKNSEPSEMEKAEARYGFDLADPVLSDSVLTDVLQNGIIEASAIRGDLDRSIYFAEASREPEWRIIWYGIDRGEESVEPAIAAMEQKYLKREYRVPGVLLHVLGLRLQLCEIGAIEKSRSDIVTDGKKYINDLLESGTLEPLPPGGGAPFDNEAYGNLRFAEVDSEEFRDLSSHLESARAMAAERRYPEDAAALLAEMDKDPELFARRIVPGAGEDSVYGRVPVLQAADPGDFVARVTKLRPELQRTVFRALRSRYEHGLTGPLSSERAWLTAVAEKFKAATAGKRPYGRHRWLTLVEHGIGQVLSRSIGNG